MRWTSLRSPPVVGGVQVGRVGVLNGPPMILLLLELLSQTPTAWLAWTVSPSSSSPIQLPAIVLFISVIASAELRTFTPTVQSATVLPVTAMLVSV